MRSFVLAVFLSLSSGISFGQTLVFPHFANGLNEDGTIWSAELDLVNTTSAEQSVTLWFTNPDGWPKVVSLPGFEDPETGSAAFFVITLSMPPHAMRVLETDGLAEPRSAGWVWIEGSGGIKAALTLRLRDAGGKVIAQAGVAPSFPSKVVDFVPLVPATNVDSRFASSTERSTAFALANTSGIEATGEIQLMSENGDLVAFSPFVLPPWGQMAQFASDLFDLSPSSRYYLRAQVASGSIAAMALSAVGSTISAVPAN